MEIDGPTTRGKEQLDLQMETECKTMMTFVLPAPWAYLVCHGIKDVLNTPHSVPSTPIWLAIIESNDKITQSETQRALTLMIADRHHTSLLPLQQRFVPGMNHCGNGRIIGFVELYRVYQDDVPSVWNDCSPYSPFYDDEDESDDVAWYFDRHFHLSADQYIELHETPLLPLNDVSSLKDHDLQKRIFDSFRKQRSTVVR